MEFFPKVWKSKMLERNTEKLAKCRKTGIDRILTIDIN